MTTLAPSILIGSSFLQVERTCIKAWLSLNFRQIRPLAMEFSALKRLKNQCLHSICVAFDPIMFKLADNEKMHNILNKVEFWPDLTTDNRVSCP